MQANNKTTLCRVNQVKKNIDGGKQQRKGRELIMTFSGRRLHSNTDSPLESASASKETEGEGERIDPLEL